MIPKLIISGAQLSVNCWKYFLLSLLDVISTYLLLLSYQYASPNTLYLCQTSSVPFCIIFAFVSLGVRFKGKHMLLIIVTITGLIFPVLVEMNKNGGAGFIHENSTNDSSSKDGIIGIISVISASLVKVALLMAQEGIVKLHDITEYYGMLGVCGTLVNSILALVMETDQMIHETSNSFYNLLSICAICLFFYYIFYLVYIYIILY